MPIRPHVPTSPGPLDATVTLQHLGTGRVVELRDSAFRFLPDPDLGSAGAYLHNFWTTDRIEAGTSYRLTVAGDDGLSAEAVIDLPPVYAVELGVAQMGGGVDQLRLEGLAHLAMVTHSTFFYDDCGPGFERVFLRADGSGAGRQRFWRGRHSVVDVTAPFMPKHCSDVEIHVG